MKERKITLGTLLCLIIIFVLIMALAAMYVYYNFTPKENYSNLGNITNNDNINNEIDNKEPVIIELDVESELAKKLYKYILKFNYYDETLVYQDKKVTYSNIDNKLKLLTTFENLGIDDAKKIKSTEYTCVVEEDGNSYKYLYMKETVEEKLKEIFGENATVEHENCSPHDGYNRLYGNGTYTCYEYAGGGDVPWSSSISNLIKAEEDGNNIYLYDNYIHLVEAESTETGMEYDIYATSDRKISIAKGINLEEDGVYEGTEELNGDEYMKVYMNNLLNILGKDKIKTFKHTFSRDDSGNYFWVSSEIVEI